MLQNQFPGLHFVHIEGYNVRYGAKKKNFLLSILRQLPRLALVIHREKAWLAEQMKIHHFDLVISDNRYGFYHHRTPSVFITHQLSIISGLGKLADNLLRKIHFRFIRRFTSCWVPDTFGMPNLSGILGHPESLPEHTIYLGPLSRLEQLKSNSTLDLLVILSGPEPQRTILESILVEQLRSYSGSYLLVRGLPGEESSGIPSSINYLGASELNRAICNAGIVISRSGYTGIMDLVKLQKKAILIPTPGQTEQEYLASYMEDQGIFLKAEQQSFDLKEALRKASGFPYKILTLDFLQYRTVLSRFIQSLP